MLDSDDVDRRRLVLSAVLLAVLAAWFALSPESALEVRGPSSYAFVALLIAVFASMPYRPINDTWRGTLLWGALFVAWGLHNLAGPESALLLGYGFVLLGLLAIAYALAQRLGPSEPADGAED